MMSRKIRKSGRDGKALESIKIQPRDRRIIWMAGVNGWVTMPQIKLYAFSHRDETGWMEMVSEQAVYRRLAKLCRAGLLDHQRTWHGDHGVYRANRAGLDLVGLDLTPASLDKRDYEHDLRVVNLALDVTDFSLDNWITERMIRSLLKPGMSIGRVPDGLILGPGGERWAVELEVSGKESQRYYDACARYATRHRVHIPEDSPDWDAQEQLDDYFATNGEIDGVVWYFFSKKKMHRAYAEAERVLNGKGKQHQQNEHTRFRFHSAVEGAPPPLDNPSCYL